jgi:hypothetical protein
MGHTHTNIKAAGYGRVAARPGDVGDWMQTYTGRAFWPLAPQADDIDPADIAHALSMLCRYGGHVERFYSVAEHCVLMSYAVPPGYALWALLHDATEAYMGDMVRPLKRSMPEYQAAEARLSAVICDRFGLLRCELGSTRRVCRCRRLARSRRCPAVLSHRTVTVPRHAHAPSQRRTTGDHPVSAVPRTYARTRLPPRSRLVPNDVRAGACRPHR